MTNNWNDIEDLLKQKIASEDGPSLDASQMWANVEQSLPKRKRKALWLFIPFFFLILSGALAFLYYQDKSSQPFRVNETSEETTSSSKSTSSKAENTSATEAFKASAKSNFDSLPDVTSDKNSDFSDKREKANRKSFEDQKGNSNKKNIRLSIQNEITNSISQAIIYSDEANNSADSNTPMLIDETPFTASFRNNSNASIEEAEVEQKVNYLSPLNGLLPVSSVSLVDQSFLYIGGYRMIPNHHSLGIYAGMGMAFPLIKSTDIISYQPIVGKEIFLGFHQTEQKYNYDVRIGISEINYAFDFEEEKTQPFTYTDVPLHVYIDSQGNFVETVNGDTTVNQTISRKIVQNNLASFISLQVKGGKSIHKNRWTYDLDLAVKAMYSTRQSGRYLLNTNDFSSIQDSKTYGIKKLTIAPGASLTANYRLKGFWNIGAEVNYFFLSKNNWNTALSHSAHLVGGGVYVRYELK